jgi:hypothetical protein
MFVSQNTSTQEKFKKELKKNGLSTDLPLEVKEWHVLWKERERGETINSIKIQYKFILTEDRHAQMWVVYRPESIETVKETHG